ncbi:MAG: hypothetical protein ACRDL7_10050 [Gaiellaceae bacterium]
MEAARFTGFNGVRVDTLLALLPLVGSGCGLVEEATTDAAVAAAWFVDAGDTVEGLVLPQLAMLGSVLDPTLAMEPIALFFRVAPLETLPIGDKDVEPAVAIPCDGVTLPSFAVDKETPNEEDLKCCCWFDDCRVDKGAPMLVDRTANGSSKHGGGKTGCDADLPVPLGPPAPTFLRVFPPKAAPPVAVVFACDKLKTEAGISSCCFAATSLPDVTYPACISCFVKLSSDSPM